MNTTGKKFGGRQKGTPNKLNSKIKDKAIRYNRVMLLALLI